MTPDAQVRKSKRLQAVLAAALCVGNAINRGTHLGDAKAVRIESLLKLADLRVMLSIPLKSRRCSEKHTLPLIEILSLVHALHKIGSNRN